MTQQLSLKHKIIKIK